MNLWQKLPQFWQRVLLLVAIALGLALVFGIYNVLSRAYPFLRAISDALCFSALILAALSIFPLFKDMGRSAQLLRSSQLTHKALGEKLARQREEREAEMRVVWAMLTAAGVLVLLSILFALIL